MSIFRLCSICMRGCEDMCQVQTRCPARQILQWYARTLLYLNRNSLFVQHRELFGNHTKAIQTVEKKVNDICHYELPPYMSESIMSQASSLTKPGQIDHICDTFVNNLKSLDRGDQKRRAASLNLYVCQFRCLEAWAFQGPFGFDAQTSLPTEQIWVLHQERFFSTRKFIHCFELPKD